MLVKGGSISTYLRVTEIDLLAKIARRQDVSMLGVAAADGPERIAPGRDREAREVGFGSRPLRRRVVADPLADPLIHHDHGEREQAPPWRSVSTSPVIPGPAQPEN